MNDWEIIRLAVAGHEMDAHGGGRCTCPQMRTAIKAAKAFQRQFGKSTKPGILPDRYDEKRDRWTTKTWMDADSTWLKPEDWGRLPKDVQQRKLRALNEELEQGMARLEATAPAAPKRRSPRDRKDVVIRTLLDGAVRNGDGTYTFTRSVTEDVARAIGKPVNDITLGGIEAWATTKLEEDRNKQSVEMGLG